MMRYCVIIKMMAYTSTLQIQATLIVTAKKYFFETNVLYFSVRKKKYYLGKNKQRNCH